MDQVTGTPNIGMRTTRQRTAVIEVLHDLGNFMAAQDIHRELDAREANVGLTTVYRTLQALVEIKAVDVLHNEGETLFRLCSDHHHHHLVCTDCGNTVEITGGPVEQWAHELADEHGFTLTGHTAEIFGVCANCRAA